MTTVVESQDLDLDKEQRRERLTWIVLGIGAMLLVIGGFFLSERSEIRVLHAYLLTIITYGILLYVDNFANLKKFWLWRAVLATIPLHLVCVSILFWWDARVPTSSGFANLGRVWLFVAVEVLAFSAIVERLGRGLASDAPRQPISRFLNRTRKTRPHTSSVLTIPDEDDLMDPAKALRKSRLRTGFAAVSVLLVVAFVAVDFSPHGFALQVIKGTLLTALAYGHLLYIERRDDLKARWLWKTVVVALPFHVAFLGLMVALDRIAPGIAPNPIAYGLVIWVFAWVETRLMDQISEDYKPLDAVSETLN
jgi:hypothetical protein